MGAIWGGHPPTQLGGNGGGHPPASLSRVYLSPPPQQRGVPMGALPFVAGPTSQPSNSKIPLVDQRVHGEPGVHRPTVLAPYGGPDGTPPIGGGVVL